MHKSAELARSLLALTDDLDGDFEARLIETSRLAFRVAFSVLRHQQDAEDVAQEAYAKAYRSFRQLRDRERFRGWLVRTTWRAALDRQRANRRRQVHEVASDEPSLEAAGDAFGARHAPRGRTSELWAAIDALPAKLRIVVLLASIEGHDVREVAALLRIPEGTVKSRLFLARQRLKEALQ